MDDLIAKASGGLDAASAELAAELLIDASISEASKRALLLAMNDRGETAEEVAAFAKIFRSHAREADFGGLNEEGIDVCGTGGDGQGTFNVSTVVSMLLAASGIAVFKHGNRSITSKCGSADLFENLGVDLEASAEQQKKVMDEQRFVFLFAPAYHPVFKNIMPVRKALAEEGKRSIFNILGPLINPARPAYQLLGVFNPQWVKPMASALGRLGLKGGLVVSCEVGEGQFADELTCSGVNHVAGFGSLASVEGVWKAEDYGLKSCSLEALAGSDKEGNLAILDALQKGDAEKGLADTICFNAGAAMWICGRAATVEDGIKAAREVLEGGRLTEWITAVKAAYAR